jgi:hypothetical protein
MDVNPAIGVIGPVAHRPLISSVRIESEGIHERVTVWTRGQCSGSLVVDAGEGEKLAERLLPATQRRASQ